ncbi:MAG: peptide-N-glycosidase F-related protein [Myxococcota bacterium]
MTSTVFRLAALSVLALGACTGTDSDVTDDTELPGPDPMCEDGLARTAFDADAAGLWFGEKAGDFTITTLGAGSWTLSDAWTGCDNYVILAYWPGNRTSEAVFASPTSTLFKTGPNVHYIFASDQVSSTDRVAWMEDLRDKVQASVDALPEGERDSWEGRLHFSTARLSNEEGGLSEMLTDYNVWAANPGNRADLGERGMASAPRLSAFGIDRLQRWDAGGSMSETVGGAQTFKLASYLGGFYDQRVRMAEEIAATEADESVLIDEEGVTDRIIVKTVDVPADRSAFDTFEFDILVDCKERNPFMCSEWDRIARIDLCLDGEDCADRREVVRWITPYWRRGERRWLIDASPLMGILPEGGQATFRIEHGPGWERATARDVRIAARFRTQGDRPKATGGARAFTGGNFNADYNTRDPFAFTPPASASRVELVTILSGHGQTNGNNCAEWCDHRHQFALNGTDLPEIASEGGIGSVDGCGYAAALGASPGQWGNWAPKRAYWCPGLPVEAERLDITDQVTLGSENQLTYQGRFLGGEPKGGSIALSAYVVWYE